MSTQQQIAELIAKLNAPWWKFWITGKAKDSAAETLAGIGQQAVPSLVNCLAGPGKFYASQALKKIGPSAAPACVRALSERSWASLVLKEIGDESCVGALIDELAGERGVAACGVLADIGPPALSPLIKALESPDRETRIWAAMALRKMGGWAVEAIPALRSLQKDPDWEVREFAKRAIKEIEPRRGRQADEQTKHVEALIAEPDAKRRVSASHVADIGPPALSPLIKALQGPDRETRIWAVMALEKMGGWAEEAIPALRGLQNDPDRTVRNMAEKAITRIELRRKRQADEQIEPAEEEQATMETCTRCGKSIPPEQTVNGQEALGKIGLGHGSLLDELTRFVGASIQACKCDRCGAWVCNDCAKTGLGVLPEGTFTGDIPHTGCGGTFRPPGYTPPTVDDIR